MKTIIFSKKFKKNFDKLNKKIQLKFIERFELFQGDVNNPVLNIHKLNPPFLNCKSFNVNGDFRVIYEKISDEEILLINIGTHSELYE
jgi:addiction module RelE/StbE family toxin